MTDQERREDEALKNCMEKAYGCTDDELLAELEEIESTLSDSDFPGIEERTYQKLMARMAGEEEANTAEASVIKAVKMPLDAKAESGTTEPGEKVVRIGKKKVLMVAVLSAAFVGMLGVTAIGGKSYFFNKALKSDTKIVFDNVKGISEKSKLETVYEEIEDKLNVTVLKLDYVPSDMKLESLEFESNRAVITFNYNDQKIYFIQLVRGESASVGIGSDRVAKGKIDNNWLDKEIEYSENSLEEKEKEYETTFSINDTIYRIFGIMEEEEFKKILEYINFH